MIYYSAYNVYPEFNLKKNVFCISYNFQVNYCDIILYKELCLLYVFILSSLDINFFFGKHNSTLNYSFFVFKYLNTNNKNHTILPLYFPHSFLYTMFISLVI